jgi:hypothetical protein
VGLERGPLSLVNTRTTDDLLGRKSSVCMRTYVLMTLREEHRLRVFKQAMSSTSIFRPKRDEETGGWRKLHNEELRQV